MIMSLTIIFGAAFIGKQDQQYGRRRKWFSWYIFVIEMLYFHLCGIVNFDVYMDQKIEIISFSVQFAVDFVELWTECSLNRFQLLSSSSISIPFHSIVLVPFQYNHDHHQSVSYLFGLVLWILFFHILGIHILCNSQSNMYIYQFFKAKIKHNANIRGNLQ